MGRVAGRGGDGVTVRCTGFDGMGNVITVDDWDVCGEIVAGAAGV